MKKRSELPSNTTERGGGGAFVRATKKFSTNFDEILFVIYRLYRNFHVDYDRELYSAIRLLVVHAKRVLYKCIGRNVVEEKKLFFCNFYKNNVLLWS